MKIFIDKHGGMHYHREDCRVVIDRNPIDGMSFGNYEGVEVAHLWKQNGEWCSITVDGGWYFPCPFCFGENRRK